MTQQKFNAVVEHFAANIAAVQENFVVLAEVEQPGADGKVTKVVVEQPVSDAMMNKVSDWYVQNPEAAKFLTVEEVTRRVYPNVAKRSAKVAPPNPPANPAQDVSGRRVVKVGSPSGSGPVANGAAAGRVPRTGSSSAQRNDGADDRSGGKGARPRLTLPPHDTASSQGR